MRYSLLSLWAAVLFVALGRLAHPGPVAAEDYYCKGAEDCKECHENDFAIWRKTKHFQNYRTFDKDQKTTEMLAALGGELSAKKNATCAKCHYTMVQKEAGKAARAQSGTSCESCHGPSSGYLAPHADKKRADRQEVSTKMGLIYSSMHYDIAANCMNCHGLARDDIPSETLAKLLASKHPIEEEFELVRYSQGSLRHRFFPPTVEDNQEMTRGELARFFIAGQAAQLVTAAREVGRATDSSYKAAQQKRVARAREALSALRAIPEAAALSSSPTEANARKLIAAIQTADLFAQVEPMLPSTSSYK